MLVEALAGVYPELQEAQQVVKGRVMMQSQSPQEKEVTITKPLLLYQDVLDTVLETQTCTDTDKTRLLI